jgi:PAS domain S-box-containing protein
MAQSGQEHRSDESAPGSERIELAQVRGFLEHARKTEEAWRLLMESVKDFAILLLDTDGRIASWNEGAARLLGYGADEIIHQPLSKLFLPEDVAAGMPQEELRIAAAKGHAIDDNWLLRKEGSRFWASGVTTPLHNPGGKLVGFAKVIRDLTERKLAEESLKKTNEELEERVRSRTRELELRVRELEAFSSSVAHDLRGPLRAIHRYAESLLDEYRNRPLDADGESSLGRILDTSRRMDDLIGHLLAYSRLTDQRLDLRTLDLGPLVREVLKDLAVDVADRRAQVDVEDPLPQVLGDPAVVSQVLTNLLSNALKFVPAGRDPRIRIRARRRDRGVRLDVEDNGIGIASEHQERIFFPFERLHTADQYPGTGVGLAIVKKAAERMGGSVGVESALGRGSRFWLELPAPQVG